MADAVMDEIQTADCEGCGQTKTCQLTGLGHDPKKWLCWDCITRGLRSILEYEDEKYRRDDLKAQARLAFDEASLLNGAGDRNQRLKAKARYRAYKAIQRKLYGAR